MRSATKYLSTQIRSTLFFLASFRPKATGETPGRTPSLIAVQSCIHNFAPAFRFSEGAGMQRERPYLNCQSQLLERCGSERGRGVPRHKRCIHEEVLVQAKETLIKLSAFHK